MAALLKLVLAAAGASLIASLAETLLGGWLAQKQAESLMEVQYQIMVKSMHLMLPLMILMMVLQMFASLPMMFAGFRWF